MVLIIWFLIALVISLFVLLSYFFSRRGEANGDNELARRLARSRVEIKWIPLWAQLGVLGYLIVYALSKFLDRSEIFDFAMPLFLGFICLQHFVLRPRRKREFRERLQTCGDRICPQCLYSLEDGRPEGTCPECGTAYTDEGLHAAWAFLHKAEQSSTEKSK